MRFGNPRHHFALTDSTNERARELAESGAVSGTVVTASEQSAGRGRRGRRWSAPAGQALLYSAVMRPLEMRDALLPLAVPIAVCEACEAVAAAECRIKWPNDIWIAEQKVAGVLIEARPPEWAVIGIGINVAVAEDAFPPDLRWPATSLGAEVDLAGLCEALNERLGSWVAAGADEVLTEFGRRDALAGRQISWEGGPDGASSGVARSVDQKGNLVVETVDGDRLKLGSGEVQLQLG